jgi:hypothetical protein
MNQDAKKWRIGVSQLAGLMQHIPTSIDEDAVEQFHGIVKLLEEASGEDLSYFKIPPEKMAPRVTSFQPRAYGGGPGSINYSKKKYCDSKYFYSQVHGLSNYIGTLGVKSPAKEANPYESLTDDQLMGLLADRNLKPKRVPGGNPEYVYDRTYAIGVLLKSGNPPMSPAPTHSTVINVHGGSNLNYNSPGASITQTVGFKGEDFRKLIDEVKQFASTQELSAENREQIKIDIDTVEVQINAQRPNPTIIRESLRSIKTILENAAGAVIASGILFQLQGYLS